MNGKLNNNRIKITPLYYKTAEERKRYLKQIDGIEISEGLRFFLLHPNRVIARQITLGQNEIAQRSRDRINEIDRKILTKNFREHGYNDEQLEKIVEQIIISTGLELRSLDPRDYTVDNKLCVLIHTIEERLKLIQDDENKHFELNVKM